MEQNKPPEGAKDCPQLQLNSQLCFPLYAAARKVVNHYTPYLKPFGITYTQYIVLLALWESGSATVGDLCRRLYLDNGTITPLLKKMEESGWIVRCRCKVDERVVYVSVTVNGIVMPAISTSYPGAPVTGSQLTVKWVLSVCSTMRLLGATHGN